MYKRFVCLLSALLAVVLASCVGAPIAEVAESTSTPIVFGCPIPERQYKMIVVLFDPGAARARPLTNVNGDKTEDILGFLIDILPETMNTGDQISIFQLGYRAYETARVARVYTYDTYASVAPSWFATETFCESGRIPKGFDRGRNGSDAANSVRERLQAQITNYSPLNSRGEEPYASDVVYDGLWHASLDFKADCPDYDTCLLLIVDDLRTWPGVDPRDYEVNLAGIDVLVVIPDCENINTKGCVIRRDYWNKEFARFGAQKVNYVTGDIVDRAIVKHIKR
jgi:hypothetical protein